MKKSIAFFVVTALILTVSLAVAGQFNKVLDIGDKAPDFSGIQAVFFDKKTGEVKETVLNLAEIKEDVVVLVFLANHCPYVVANEQRLNEFVAHFTPKDAKEQKVKVIALSVSLEEADKFPKIKEYVKKHQSAYVYGYDATQKVGRAYGAANTPQYVVLDKERNIRYMGALDDVALPSVAKKPTKHYLRDAVDALLKGEKPPIEETRQSGCGIEYTRAE